MSAELIANFGWQLFSVFTLLTQVSQQNKTIEPLITLN